MHHFLHLLIFNFRSERDVNSVEITHQEKTTKIDKVNLPIFIRYTMASKNWFLNILQLAQYMNPTWDS